MISACAESACQDLVVVGLIAGKDISFEDCVGLFSVDDISLLF